MPSLSQGEELCGGAVRARGAAAAVKERPEGQEGGRGSRQRGGGASGDAQWGARHPTAPRGDSTE